MAKKPIQAVKGTRDFYPEDMRCRKALIKSLRQTTESFGYQEYDAPLLESLDLYAAKSSREIIERQSYTFDDRGGERLVVRPEMTPSLARMIAAKQRTLVFPLRWYSLPECWRYERPQKGRLRNFLQLNVDLIGSDSVEADVEIIDLALSIIRGLNIDMDKIELRLNDRGLLSHWMDDCAILPENRGDVLSLLDQRDKLEPKSFRDQLSNYLNEAAIAQLMTNLNMSEERLLQSPGVERLATIRFGLNACGWEKNVRIDPTIIRGFDYYTGTVFEVYETSGEFRRAIFGGGRYNNLVEAVGGEPISAVGFGVSDVSLQELLKTQQREMTSIPPACVMLIPDSIQDTNLQNKLAIILRQAGIPTITSLPPFGFSDQLKQAQRQKYPLVILLTQENTSNQKCILRDMQTGKQEEIPLNQIVCRVFQKLN